MTADNFLPVTYSIDMKEGRFFMVVEEGGRKKLFPAASRLEAEIMIALEKKRRQADK